MTADRFPVCLAETLRWEGGYSDHPDDPGGATMAGVIQRVYDGWRDQMGLQRQHVREISQREIVAIYQQNYWRAVRGDELPPGLDLAVFDFGVNSGPSRAVRALQACLGVNVDGHLGAATITAAQRVEDMGKLLDAYHAERRRFVRQIRHYAKFAKGWERRINGISTAARAAAGAFPHPPKVEGRTPRVIEVPFPLPDPDAQSAEQGRATAGPPPKIGLYARIWGWLAGGLGLGGLVGEGMDAAGLLGSIDPGRVVSVFDRVEPLLMRITTSPTVWAAMGLGIVGVALWRLARSADRHELEIGI